jgi:hypothetical protein
MALPQAPKGLGEGGERGPGAEPPARERPRHSVAGASRVS